jgi:molybdopterin converting factor small subunit
MLSEVEVQISIEFHGVLRRLAGMDQTTLDVSNAALVSEVLVALENKLPTLSEILEITACAVGDELVNRNSLLSDGDRLVLIPPVSGG